MEFLTFLLAAFVGLIIFWFLNLKSGPKNFPPGALVFPIVGSLPHFIRTSFLAKLEEWKEEYGNIFSMKLGRTSAVIINDYDLIKEAFNNEQLTGRPTLAPITLIAGKEKRGLIASEGESWEAQRRFALRQLRDLGFGKKSMEGTSHEDILDLINNLRKDAGIPISTANRFNMSVLSSLWIIIAGQQYSIDDPRFLEVVSKLKTAVSTAGQNAPAFIFDWLIKIAPDLTGWNKFKTSIIAAKDFIREEVLQHQKTFQEGDFRDYIDVYLNEMHHTTDPNSTFYKTVGEENLIVGTLNLFGAGTETTSSTLTWAFLFLSRNPDVQRKLHEEIDRVIGNSRLPSLNDRDSMPYATAVIHEVFRKSSLTPIGIPHRALSDVNFHGYTIPKGTIVFANLYDVHHDKKKWGDPEVFRPERFLTEDGTAINKNHPVVAPFSAGRRQCLGETLARNNVFLFLLSLVQAFEIKVPTGASPVKEPSGLFRFPPEFEVILEERHPN